jgi:hypothetical protein
MRLFLSAALLLPFAWGLQHGAPQGASDSPAELWAARCAACHTVPDPGLRADRAWLDQVRRTT